MVWLCSSGSDEFVANPPREWQIGEGPMKMPQLASAQPEFNAPETMVVSRHALPLLNGLTHDFDCCVLHHDIRSVAVPL